MWSDAEELRIKNLEEAVNKQSTAINNLASKQQLRQLLLIRQAEIDTLKTRVAALESQIEILQSQV